MFQTTNQICIYIYICMYIYIWYDIRQSEARANQATYFLLQAQGLAQGNQGSGTHRHGVVVEGNPKQFCDDWAIDRHSVSVSTAFAKLQQLHPKKAISFSQRNLNSVFTPNPSNRLNSNSKLFEVLAHIQRNLNFKFYPKNTQIRGIQRNLDSAMTKKNISSHDETPLKGAQSEEIPPRNQGFKGITLW